MCIRDSGEAASASTIRIMGGAMQAGAPEPRPAPVPLGQMARRDRARAVSYTHLDVYKRQLYARLAEALGVADGNILRSSIAVMYQGVREFWLPGI